MKPPAWAPLDLVEKWKENESFWHQPIVHDQCDDRSLLQRLDADDLMANEESTWKDDVRQIKHALIFDPKMERVWADLRAQSILFLHHETDGPFDLFKPELEKFGLGKADLEQEKRERAEFQGQEYELPVSQSLSLHDACEKALVRWHMIPKITNSQRRELYADIASTAKRLRNLVLRVDGTDQEVAWDMRSYLEEDRIEGITWDLFSGITGGGTDEDWRSYIYSVKQSLGVLPPLPVIIRTLEKRALDWSKVYFGVSQPRVEKSGELYFVRSISDYFDRSYGKRMHEIVAIVTNVVRKTNFTGDNIKAIVSQSRRRPGGHPKYPTCGHLKIPHLLK